MPLPRGVMLEHDAGEKLALTGGSGSGKKPPLFLVTGPDAVDGGCILLDWQA